MNNSLKHWLHILELAEDVVLDMGEYAVDDISAVRQAEEVVHALTELCDALKAAR